MEAVAMVIRQYRAGDSDAVQRICIENSKSFAGGDHAILLNLYCRYYLEQEPENCFVTADEDDRPVGYIYGAAEWETYCRIFYDIYLPELKIISEKHYNEKIAEDIRLAPLAVSYPAHLHIDVLAGYREKGVGARLMERLLDKLKSDGVAGVMLCVGLSNTSAHRFYERAGFTKIAEIPGSAVYAKRLVTRGKK